MDIITLDFETYYTQEFSLTKITTDEYINDPMFQVIGVGIKFNDKPSRWYSGEVVGQVLQLIPWRKVAVLAHNARFDMSILALRYGIHPRFILDTLSMAQPIHSANVGGSLKKLATHYALGEKGTEVVDAKGKRLEDFSAAELHQYGEYCKNDCDLTYALLGKLRPLIPLSELRLIDMTIRMYTKPALMLDTETIQREIDLEIERKAELLALVDQPEGAFSSNPKFADLLRSLGVEPPMKPSPKKKNEDGTPMLTYAFAKGDADFIALLDHDDPLVSAAVEVRLGVKSTQRFSRATRFMGIAERNGGKLAVPLAYYAAHTGRYGGTESVNLQNLQRTDNKDPNKGLLRKAITAPDGHMLVVEDSAQIEARLLVWQANQLDRVEAFAQGRDVYSEQASVIYGRTIDRKKNPDDFVPGFIGKAVVLGCGFGLGFSKFSSMIYVGMLGAKGILFDDAFVEALDVDVDGFVGWIQRKEGMAEAALKHKPFALTEDAWLTHLACGQKIITTFRAGSEQITDYWKIASRALTAMVEGYGFEFGGPTACLLRTHESSIVLPNGMAIRYEGLERDEEGSFSYLRRKEGRVQRVRTYGGSVVENCTQALARIVITDAMLRIEKETGCPVALQVHDEVVVVAPAERAEEVQRQVREIMQTPPAWAVGLPLSSEGSVAFRYGEAK